MCSSESLSQISSYDVWDKFNEIMSKGLQTHVNITP